MCVRLCVCLQEMLDELDVARRERAAEEAAAAEAAEEEARQRQLDQHHQQQQEEAESALPAAPPSRYTDVTDRGVCLSMHQPWASLLVAGFKRVEGRSWPTEHRGRLWVHATVKDPLPALTEQLMAHYSDMYGGNHAPLPTSFPTGMVLGCVDLEECITQVSGCVGACR